VKTDPNAVRVWRGFRSPEIDLPAFYQRLETVFVPSTVLMQIDIGLQAYIPTVLGGLPKKPDTVPDETAILFWESQQTYHDGFKTLAVRTYTLTHGAVYTPASGAEFPDGFSGELQANQPYSLVDRSADWMQGTVRHLVGARPEEVEPEDFHGRLAAVLAKGTEADGGIVCAGDDYLVYWQLDLAQPAPGGGLLEELAGQLAWSHSVAAEPTSLDVGLWEEWPGLPIEQGQSLNMQFERRSER
jgi:hypothetical protein